MILSLSVLGNEDADISAAAGVTSSEDGSKAMRMMIVDAFASMIMLSIRISLAKYCTRVLSTMTYLKLYLLMDSLCAVFVTILSALNVIELPLYLYVEPETLMICLPAGAFAALAELFVTLALNEGPTGPITAVISFSSVFVSVASWAIDGSALSPMQIIGILVALCGVFTVSKSNSACVDKDKKGQANRRSDNELRME